MVLPDSRLVSVVIPAFNDERFIAEAIDSALAQDYADIEVIVVDDGSKDGTCDIVAGYGDRVRLIRQANQGAAVARNTGIESALGFYIAFLDADDYWAAHKIRLQVQGMRAGGYKMAYSRFITWHRDAQGHFPDAAAQFESSPHPRLAPEVMESGWNYTDLLLDCIVWTSTVIVEAGELRRCGLFNPEFRKGQDYELWLRLARQIAMLALPEPTALYRMNDASITHRLSDICYEYRIVSSAIEKWGEYGPDKARKPDHRLIKARLRRMLFNHGLAHYRRGKVDIAIESFSQLIRRHGFQAKPFVYLMLARLKNVGAPNAQK